MAKRDPERDPLPPPAAGPSDSMLDALLGAAFEKAPAAAAGATPLDAGIPAQLSARYRVEGEIGRGGVGIVLRAQDVELGRAVALKILRREHLAHEGLTRRFIEEAQIGGQLEHPGIVPVHEMGRAPDGRPFFVMKLIQGRTLADLFAARTDPSLDRARLLAIFEQVCLTVAYAHARGVIHRDLKPANVMVGAFGEVQVADWGLAKVVGRPEPPLAPTGTERSRDPGSNAARESSARAAAAAGPVSTDRTSSSALLSQAGAVLGTLAYMAPEQARGETEAIDARADVFALGAMLIELLTGKPPYGGDSGEQFDAARQAALGPALARLAAPMIDATLAELARACVAPSREARPADAGVVARRVEEWRLAQESRAHAAELAVASAQAKASEERRARRLTMALAGTVLVAALGGGSVWLAQERSERIRRETAATPVREAMARARALARQAQPQPRHLVAPRAEALAAADAAVAATRAADPGAALQAEVVALHDELAAAVATSEAAASDLQRDRSTLSELWSLMGRWDVWPWDEIDRATEAAFREWGFDFETMDDAALVSRVQRSSDPIEFCDQLFGWMRVRAQIAGRDAEPRDFVRMRDVVQAADPDPWRVRLRGAIATPGGRDIWAAALIDPQLWQQPSRTIAFLGYLLNQFDARDAARTLFDRAATLYPREVGFRFELGAWHRSASPPQWTLALDHASAAAMLAPEMTSAWLLLGVVRDALGDFDGAIAACERVLELDPGNRDAAPIAAMAHVYAGRFDAALLVIEAALVHRPAGVELLHARAVAELASGRVDAARATLRAVLEGDSELAAVPQVAMSLTFAGDPRGAMVGLRRRLQRVNLMAPLSLVIGLHEGLVVALEESGDLEGAKSQLNVIRQVVLQRASEGPKRDESLKHLSASIARLDDLIRLVALLPDFQGGALAPADGGEAARVALLLARAGASVDAFDAFEALASDPKLLESALLAEPKGLVIAARSAAALLADPSTPAPLRGRAAARLAEWLRSEADAALDRQGREPFAPARSRVHALLVDPAFLVVRDADLRSAIPEPDRAVLAELAASLRKAMQRTRP